MAMQVALSGVRQIQSDLWEAYLTPSEVRRLGACQTAFGEVSIVLVDQPNFEKASLSLRFVPDNARVLNVGKTDRAMIFGVGRMASSDDSKLQPVLTKAATASSSLHGDQQFIAALNELPEDLRQVGSALLHEVRTHFPGDLKPVGSRRFQETPDNFWFVTIQPRDQSLSITVRGLPDRFAPSRIKVVEDRRPYSRFKIKSMDELRDAVQIIIHAIRRH